MFLTIFKTVPSGDNSITFTDARCGENDIYDVYADSNDIVYTSVTVSGHTVTINFNDVSADDVNIAIFVNSLDGEFIPFSGDYEDLTNKPTLFSGNYNDLTNKPTIPSVSVTPLLTEGEHIADIDIDDNTFEIYAPQGGGSGSIEYSTDEKIIGKWIDNKPLYSKTLSMGNISSASGTYEIAHGIQNISEIIDIKTRYNRLYGFRISGNFYTSSEWCSIAIVPSGNIAIFKNAMTVNNLYITLYYTKTTD